MPQWASRLVVGKDLGRDTKETADPGDQRDIQYHVTSNLEIKFEGPELALLGDWLGICLVVRAGEWLLLYHLFDSFSFAYQIVFITINFSFVWILFTLLSYGLVKAKEERFF